MKNLVVRREPGRTENGKEKHGRLGAVFGSACLSELALDRECDSAVLVIEIPGRDALRCVRESVGTARVNRQKLRNINLKVEAVSKLPFQLQKLNIH